MSGSKNMCVVGYRMKRERSGAGGFTSEKGTLLKGTKITVLVLAKNLQKAKAPIFFA